MKSNKKSLVVIVFMIFAMGKIFSQDSQEILFSDALFSVSAISYTDFDFSGHSGFFAHQQLIVHGWSRDGNIFYSQFILELGFRSYWIMNLITGRIIWGDLWTDLREKTTEDILEIMSRFNIEPNVGYVGEFPYILNNNTYVSFGVIEEFQPPNLGGGGWGYSLINIYVRKNEIQQKQINTIQIRHSIQDFAYCNETSSLIDIIGDRADSLRFRYARSPFENRIAVIVFVPQIHSSFGYAFYGIRISGSHLDIGFN